MMNGKIKLILGPCVIEGKQWLVDVAGQIKEVVDDLDDGDIDFYFKSSVVKANRTSADSFESIGALEGIGALEEVNFVHGCKTTTDVHDPFTIDVYVDSIDMVQVPAFLCRQTPLIHVASNSGLPVNIKKGQFLSPEEARQVYRKAKALGGEEVYITERGSCFGYNRLVNDFPGLVPIANEVPLIFDCTHSLQLPGQKKTRSGGQRRAVGHLARAAAATGLFVGYFAEVHPNPDQAKSDPSTQLPLKLLRPWLETLLDVHRQYS